MVNYLVSFEFSVGEGLISTNNGKTITQSSIKKISRYLVSSSPAKYIRNVITAESIIGSKKSFQGEFVDYSII